MAMRRSATGLLVLAVMTAGCGDRSADGERAATVSVVNEPAVRIGVADGDERYQFHQVRGVRRLSDGRIVVANGGSGEVRIYDADGEFDLSTGGAGDGPGEFRSLASIDVLPGDSLLALDGGNRRVSVLDPAGAYVRSWTFESPGRGLYPSAAHALPDGSVVIAYFRGRMPGDPPGVFRAAAPVVRYSADGAELGPIGELAGDEWYYSEEHHTLSDRAFGRKGHLAVHDTLIFLGDAAEPAVRVVSTSGAVRTIATDSARPVTAADIARVHHAGGAGGPRQAEHHHVQDGDAEGDSDAVGGAAAGGRVGQGRAEQDDDQVAAGIAIFCARSTISLSGRPPERSSVSMK
jgi:hypothetical protein